MGTFSLPVFNFISHVSQGWSLVALHSRAVLILGGVTVFAPLIEGGTTHFPVFIIRLSLFLFCLGWIISQKKGGVLLLYRNKISPLLLCLLVLAFISVTWTSYKDMAMQWVVTLVMYAVFFQTVYQGVKSLRDVRMLVMIFLGMGAFQAALGIIQCLGAWSYRAYGTFFNPNFFATYQVGVLILITALLCYSDETKLTKRERIVLYCIAILSLSAFLLARSRGALIALIPILTFIGYLRFGKRVIPLLLACVLAVILVPNPIRERGLEVAAHDPFAYTRIDIWKNAINRIVDYPWGVGLGMYKYVSFQSRFPVEGAIVRFGKRAESAHNEYLQIAAELGVAGLLIFLIGAIVWTKEAWKIFVDEQTSMQRGVVLGLTGIVLAILLHASVDSVFHEPALVLLLILAGGMVLAVGRIRSGLASEAPEISIRYSAGRTVIAVITTSILVALTIQPAMAWYAFEQGNKATGSRQLDLALHWYRGATMIEPWNAAYHDAIASSEIALFRDSGEQGWILDAVEEMKMCMSLNGLDGRYPFRLGTLYQLLGERVHASPERDDWFRQATASYRMAVMTDPYSPMNYVALGRLRRLQGDLHEARSSFSQAIEYEPNYLPARALRIQVTLELGDHSAARHDYLELLAIRGQLKERATNATEQQFLDIDLDMLKRMFQS